MLTETDPMEAAEADFAHSRCRRGQPVRRVGELCKVHSDSEMKG